MGNKQSQSLPTFGDLTNPDVRIQDSDKLEFYIEIKNIRVHNSAGESDKKVHYTSRVELEFGEETKFEIDEEKNPQAWALHKEFSFKIEKGGLRQASLKMTFFDRQKVQLGTIMTPLYDIAIGPFHHDFAIKPSKGLKNVGRVHFDVKMSQMITIMIQPNRVKTTLLKNMTEKYYNFSMKMRSRKIETESEHSVNFVNPLFENEAYECEPGEGNYEPGIDEAKRDKLKTQSFHSNFEKMHTIDDDNSESESEELPDILPLKRSCSLNTRTRSRMVTELVRNVSTWNFDAFSKRAPLLKLRVSYDELINGSFILSLWADPDLPEPIRKVNSKEYREKSLISVGECYVAIGKILYQEEEKEEGNTKHQSSPTGRERSYSLSRTPTRVKGSYHSHTSKAKEKLWFHGLEIGEIEGEFVVECSPYYCQMVVGVRTEEGIKQSKNLYLQRGEKKKLCAKKRLADDHVMVRSYFEKLKNSFFSYSKAKTDKEKYEQIDELAFIINKLEHFVEVNTNESAINPVYRNSAELLNGQKLLIEVAKCLFEFTENFPPSMRPRLFKILNMIITRKDLGLSFLGFSSAEKAYLRKETSREILSQPDLIETVSKKLKVAEEYQNFLYTVLAVILKQINFKGLDQQEKLFFQQFLALSYFRVPEFQTILINSLHNKNLETPITDWKESDWDINSNALTRISPYFDWESNFYEPLKITKSGKINCKFISDIIQDGFFLSETGIFEALFYKFFESFNTTIEQTFPNIEQIPWKEIPGYPVLVKSFLLRMKASHKVQYWPADLSSATITFMNNPNLLNPFISMLYSKTSLLDPSTVFSVYGLINDWFCRMRNYGIHCPPNFDFIYFILGIKKVIGSEQSICMARCIKLIYYNFNFFPIKVKLFFAFYFLKDYFFHLFLHWDGSVRFSFYHLLLYRFRHQYNRPLTNKSLKEIELVLKMDNDDTNANLKELLNDYIYHNYTNKMAEIKKEYDEILKKRVLGKRGSKKIGTTLQSLNKFELEKKATEGLGNRGSIRDSPDKKYTFHRKIYDDLNFQAPQTITDELVPYIENGYNKYLKIEENYLAWVQRNEKKLKTASLAQKEKILNDPDIDEFNLHMRIDRQEEKDIVKFQ